MNSIMSMLMQSTAPGVGGNAGEIVGRLLKRKVQLQHP